MFFKKLISNSFRFKRLSESTAIVERVLNETKDTTYKTNKVFVVDDSGAHIFPCISTQDLIEKYRPLLRKIRESFDIDDELYAATVGATILSFIKIVNVLPASEGNHDNDPGGLLRHTLHVCLNALQTVGESNPFASDAERLSLATASVIASLLHDLGKIFTDIKVFAQNGRHFNPLISPLDDFLIKEQSDTVRIEFIRGRAEKHKNESFKSAHVLLKNSSQTLTLLGSMINVQELIDGTHYLWAQIRQADGNATVSKESIGSSLVNIPTFLKAKLLSALSVGDIALNDVDADVFRVADGIVIGAMSDALLKLQDLYFCLQGKKEKEENAQYGYEYSEVSKERTVDNFISSMRTCGMLMLYGTSKVYCWHRITIGTTLIYVYGLLIRIKELDSLNKVNWVARGSSPYELEKLTAYLENTYNKKVLKIKIPNGALLNRQLESGDIELSNITFDEHSKIIKTTARVIKKRGKNIASATKVSAAAIPIINAVDIEESKSGVTTEKSINNKENTIINSVNTTHESDDKTATANHINTVNTAKVKAKGTSDTRGKSKDSFAYQDECDENVSIVEYFETYIKDAAKR